MDAAIFLHAVLLAFTFDGRSRFVASCFAVCSEHVEDRRKTTTIMNKYFKEMNCYDVLIMLIFNFGCEQIV
jgi:hypothetical protein